MYHIMYETLKEQIYKIKFKKLCVCGLERRPQKLRALDILAENPGFVPSTCIVAYSHQQLQV